ncbi:MAG TPA: hypothetical protein VEL51_24655 [Vicinamibacterales bacterium]|nr:hypothetical protein [Vicinamibacterales bacterium]
MNDLTRHAVLIEPDGALRELVLAWKSRAAARWPSSAYVAHPPHSTVWAGEVADAVGAEEAVRAVAAALPEFCTTRHVPHVFYNDAFAAGGHTCAFAAGLTDDLARLQFAVCDAIRPHAIRKADSQLPVALRRDPFLRSWRQYGFPFVGSHWIPHLTIASVPTRPDDPFVAEFLASAAGPPQAVRAVSWWRITGERHERLASMRLAPRTPEVAR